VIQSRFECQISVDFSKKNKKKKKNMSKCEHESHECVCGGVLGLLCVCSADSSTQSFDIPPDSSELFTVPGLSEREGEKEGGEVRRGREKPRQKVGLE